MDTWKMTDTKENGMVPIQLDRVKVTDNYVVFRNPRLCMITLADGETIAKTAIAGKTIHICKTEIDDDVTRIEIRAVSV